MRIGVTGPDILLNKGGASIHTLNMLLFLKDNFEMIYLPDPNLYGLYRKRREELVGREEEIKALGVKIISFFESLLQTNASYNKIITSYAQEKFDFLFSFEFINSTLFPSNFILDLSRKTRLKFGVVLMDIGDTDLKFNSYTKSTIKMSKSLHIFFFRIYHFINRKLMIRLLLGARNLVFIIFINKYYKRNLKLEFNNIEIVDPSNGIGNLGEISPFTPTTKKTKIIFFSRMTYSKGLFDIIPITLRILEKYDATVTVVGNFEWDYEKTAFFDMIRKHNLANKIVYKGYLSEKDLKEELSTSKVMIYPSHSDSFSRALAQALYFKTPVVAYDIAGLATYKGLKPVKLINEFDYDSMATEAIKLLKSDQNDDLFDLNVDDFLRIHTWKNVAVEYNRIIEKYLPELLGSAPPNFDTRNFFERQKSKDGS